MLFLVEGLATHLAEFRVGTILGKGKLLKHDHAMIPTATHPRPKTEDLNVWIHVGGAPFFRKLKNLNVYATGAPTLEGIQVKPMILFENKREY